MVCLFYMKIEKKPIVFEDARGWIRDILIGEEIEAVAIFSCTPGSVRGNHFHKESLQYAYVVSGKLIYAAQMGDGPIEKIEIGEGDLVFNPPGEKHAFKAIEYSIFLSLNRGPRKGKDYEKDTYRLDKPILE